MATSLMPTHSGSGMSKTSPCNSRDSLDTPILQDQSTPAKLPRTAISEFPSTSVQRCDTPPVDTAVENESGKNSRGETLSNKAEEIDDTAGSVDNPPGEISNKKARKIADSFGKSPVGAGSADGLPGPSYGVPSDLPWFLFVEDPLDEYEKDMMESGHKPAPATPLPPWEKNKFATFE